MGLRQTLPDGGSLRSLPRSIGGDYLEAALVVPCREDAHVSRHGWAPPVVVSEHLEEVLGRYTRDARGVRLLAREGAER
eukprot:15292725-Alexandrium_andersonii.AAC.1